MIKRDSDQGFTLIELIVVLTISAVVTAYALPSFFAIVSNARLRTDVRQLQESISYSRMIAISKSRYSVLCPWNETDGCHSDWNQPLAIFMDANKDLKPDTGEPLRVIALSNSQTITPRPVTKRYIRFSPTGLIHGISSSFILCSRNPENSVNMAYMPINRAGRTFIEWDKDHDNRIRLRSGTVVTC